jgi:hypothetical protein
MGWWVMVPNSIFLKFLNKFLKKMEPANKRK